MARAEAAECAAAEAAAAGEALQAELERARKAHEAGAPAPPRGAQRGRWG
jgi:hypothetical protein